MRMRINRYLARAGVASRRKSEELIREGRVFCNGKPVETLSTMIEPGDRVVVDGKDIQPPKQTSTYLYHKPRGSLCSHFDPHGGRLIYEDLPDEPGLFSIGRLDRDSEGLLLVTNDGAFSQQIAHPSANTEKEYLVVLDRALDEKDRLRALRGIHDGKEVYHPDRIWIFHQREASDHQIPDWPPDREGASILHIVLHEGRKREIRRLFHRLGYEVIRLIRVRIGSLRLGTLAPGEWIPLNSDEKKEVLNDQNL